MAVHVDPALPIHPLTGADVDAMVAAGILGEHDRVELLDGVLVEVSPPSSEHSMAVRRLTTLARHLAGNDELDLSVQNPLQVADLRCRPEPDMAIVPRNQKWEQHASGALLVVEVSVSSRLVDLGRKAEIYAAGRIPEYWVLDVEGRELVVHRAPDERTYRDVRRAVEGQQVTAAAVDLTVAVGDLLPPAQ